MRSAAQTIIDQVGGVGFEFGVVDVGFDEPDLAVLEVGEKLRVLFGIKVAGPDHFGAVDVGAVVDPFVVDVVIIRVAHDDQVFSGRG